MTPLVTQISWTNHLLIMLGCKTDEERQLDRQVKNENENPSVGLLLYKTILEKKLKQLVNIPQIED